MQFRDQVRTKVNEQMFITYAYHLGNAREERKRLEQVLVFVFQTVLFCNLSTV